MIIGRRVKRSRKGGLELRLPTQERDFLRTLGPQMHELFESTVVAPEPDPALDRLFPTAYPDDADRQTEYRLLVHDELRDSLVAAVDALSASVSNDHLSDEEAHAWLRALNQVRLVLGARLEITEEGDERPTRADDPRFPAFAAYDYLSMLQGELIDAMSG